MFCIGDVVINGSGKLFKVAKIKREGCYDLVRIGDGEVFSGMNIPLDHPEFKLYEPGPYAQVAKAFGTNYINNIRAALDKAQLEYKFNRERDDIVWFFVDKSLLPKAQKAIEDHYAALDKSPSMK